MGQDTPKRLIKAPGIKKGGAGIKKGGAGIKKGGAGITVFAAILESINQSQGMASLQVDGSQGLGSILAPKMAPKTTPNRSQSESKIKTKNGSCFYPSWKGLGAILGRFWTSPGGPKSGFSFGFTMIFEKSTFSKKE